ncbi:ABC transporter ATP-binding protein [Arthrobacter gyeryongensis]|uniref:ABC transporter ATP-binding protein n=1 Tax=Arthrobacter gyeryongensis TaxID=1650592 RepID=A0ABP9SDZ1_9MICC
MRITAEAQAKQAVAMNEKAKHDAQPTRAVAATLAGVGKTFTSKGRQVDALQGIDLTVREGEYVVVLGPSGCGKSTLIRCIAGLESPTAGTIELGGKTVYDAERSITTSMHKRDVGMVFQNYALWPHMTIQKNVAYPLKMRRVPNAERVKRVAEVLEVLACDHLAGRLPAELSGGQQQRVALARALVYEPALLLLDEPLSNLDALLKVSLRSELLRLHRLLGYTGIHITHDQEEALEMGDRVVLMREGKIEQMGPPEEVYRRPVSPYAANFLGVRNRVKVTLSGGHLEHNGRILGTTKLTNRIPSGQEGLELFVRARDTHVVRGPAVEDGASDQIKVEGTIAQVVLGDGGRRQYVVDIGGHFWYAQHPESEGLTPGESVHVRVQSDMALLYQGDNLIDL